MEVRAREVTKRREVVALSLREVIDDVEPSGEGGLLGIAVREGQLFAYYTAAGELLHPGGGAGRVQAGVRMVEFGGRPERDLDLIAPMAAQGLVRVAVSVTSLDRKLARAIDPEGTNRIILNAMKKHGIILADIGSNFYISGAPDPRWDNDDLRALRTIRPSDFEVIQMGTIFNSANPADTATCAPD